MRLILKFSYKKNKHDTYRYIYALFFQGTVVSSLIIFTLVFIKFSTKVESICQTSACDCLFILNGI